MKYCQNCNTYYKDDAQTCVICGRGLIDKESNNKIIMPGYPDITILKSKVKTFLKFYLLIAISISIIVGVINLITLDSFPYPWSLIIIGSLLFIGNIIWFIVFSIHNYTTKTVRQLFIVSILLILVDYFTNYKGWALGYVIPFLAVSTTLVLPIIVSTMPKRYYLHVRSLLLLVIIDIVIAVLSYSTNLMMDQITWTGVMTGLSGIILGLSMFIIAPKITYHELVKIFYL